MKTWTKTLAALAAAVALVSAACQEAPQEQQAAQTEDAPWRRAAEERAAEAERARQEAEAAEKAKWAAKGPIISEIDADGGVDTEYGISYGTPTGDTKPPLNATLRDKVAADPTLKEYKISFLVFDGDRVEIMGEVPSAEVKARVEALVKETEGVGSVVNNLEVEQ